MKNKISLVLSVLFISLCSCDVNIDHSNDVSTNSEEKVINNEVINIYKENNSLPISTVSEAVEKVYDSVVVINAYMTNGYGSGSGVIIGESENNSYIITCHHVIEDADTLEVILSNQETYSATLIGGDPTTDIAVVSINKTGLNVASFTSDSDKVKLGSTAIAIGNPLGVLANSVTSGIISSVNREILMSDGTTQELIQTDAAINSGNSGGGLFNVAGELIGIVSAKYSATGVEGLGFAVPSNIAKDIATELMEQGYVTGRYNLGITISDGYTGGGGFFGTSYKVTYISAVEQDGCCYNILQTNDILNSIKIVYADTSKESVELSSISNADETYDFLNNSEISIGDTIVFGVKRNGYSGTVNNYEVLVSQYIYK